MKPRSLSFLFLFVLVSILTPATPAQTYQKENQGVDSTSVECTIGVASGKATPDGRPLVWKTRDLASRPNNEIYFNTDSRYGFVSVVNAGGTYSWMGVNEKGFAILNSYSGDLSASGSGLTNGLLMKTVLGVCATVADFQHFLDSTNVRGRKTQANFGVIDATGAAAIFETGGTFYRKFDANDPSQAPDGTLVRTNFSVTGGGDSGIERYNRSKELIGDFASGDSLTFRTILRHQMRDFSDFDSNPVPVPFPRRWKSDRPFGYIYTGVSICRSSSVSAAVIHGVLPDEDPRFTTLWAILGQPASSIAVPYWPIGETPPEADGDPTAPLCDEANRIKSLLFDYTPNTAYIDSYKLRDENGNGLWARTFPAEDSIFTATEARLADWQQAASFPASELEATESEMAGYALRKLKQAYRGLATSISPGAPRSLPDQFSL
ncbi:MAG: hypothetical protein GXO76_02625, partial [Calditrichaeota bacterium]|nr:hypothetical protein [Calditrichota bacterium]